jgi:hypothetical protein
VRIGAHRDAQRLLVDADPLVRTETMAALNGAPA